MNLLMKNRRVLTRNLQINDVISSLTVAQLLFLEAEESTKPIHMYINSPGGSVTAGMGIYDTVRTFHPVGLSSNACTDAGKVTARWL